MEPVGQSSGTSTSTRCIETKSKCVIWDGPDIDCLGVRLCKGQSIEVIVYHTANALCLLLESLNISNVDLACLTPPADVEGPSNIVELSELIITKLCELNDAVETLENTGAQDIIVPLPDCDAIIANCPANITTQYVDGTGATVTGLLLISADGQTSPAVEYFAGLICELLCRMSTLETRVDDLRTDVDNLINQIAGALPPVQLPCDKINGIGLGINQQIVNPDDPTEGVIPDIAEKVCDIITELTGNSDITTLNSYPDISPFVDCLTTLSTAAPVGVYPGMGVPPVTLADLGAYANPQNLREIMSNAWVAICDLRNFAEIVKASCCPTYCASIEYELGASLPPLDGTRETIRIILSGSFVNFYGGTISANSVVPAPGLGAGAPNTYDGATPFVVTITDQSLNSVVFNEPSVESLFTPGNFFDATGLVPPLNPLEDYTVSITGYLQAPDFTICNFSLNTVVPAVCDNQPLAALVATDVGFDGVTLQYTLPGGAWPASGTTPQSFEIEIWDTNLAALVDSGTIDYAVYPSNYLFLYSDVNNVLPDPSFCNGGCSNFFQTNAILPNNSYEIKIRILYNCGSSVQTVCTPFTTFIPIEITLNGSIADACVVDGDFALVPEGATPPGDISANFSDTVLFNPSSPTTITVFAKAGTKFGFNLNTPYIIDSVVGVTSCPTNNGVQCWGPPSLYKYSPLGVYNTVFADTISQYTMQGCYDYVDCQILGDLAYLSYAGLTSIKNIVNTGTVSQQPGNASEYYDNSPTSGTYDDLEIPALYNPNVDPNPITITVNPSLHIMNGGATPNLYISIVDTGTFFASKGLIYFPAPSVTNFGTAPVGVPITISYNARTKSWLGLAPGDPTSWTSVFTTAGSVPIGVPLFMRITIQKWTGLGYTTNANSVYYVTSDWLTQGLPGINTPTGFLMSGLGLQLRDKIKIEWSNGVTNNDANVDYINTGIPGVNDKSYGKITVMQDPYTGILGPFQECDAKGNQVNNTYTEAKDGITAGVGAGCNLWGDINNFPQEYFATTLTINKVVEFVVTGDTTITWEIGDTTPITC